MSEPFGLNEMDAHYARERRDHRFCAWLFVNVPGVLGLLEQEPSIAKLDRDELDRYTDACDGFHEAWRALIEQLKRLRLIFSDQTPSEVVRSNSTLRQAWVAGGHDPAELTAMIEATVAMFPFGRDAQSVGQYLYRHGLTAEEINTLLATWSRQDAA